MSGKSCTIEARTIEASTSEPCSIEARRGAGPRPGAGVARAGALPALGLVLALAAGPAAAQQAGRADPCADLGSFVVVDPPPLPRGQPLVAQPYQPCADLPGAPQPQVFIDAQVPVSPPGGMETVLPSDDTGLRPGRPRGWDDGAQRRRLHRP